MSKGLRRKAEKNGPPRAWQRMLSGRRLDLLDPSPLDIEIEDIAHGLARVARWNGQTIGDHAFSVAQHVLLVEEIAGDRNPGWPARWRLAALLHDAPEYVIGDLIVSAANQEHGIIALRPESTGVLPEFAVGTRLRILPNHACATAAQFDDYAVLRVDKEAPLSRWPRFGGW